MITNERQYKITKRQLASIQHAIKEFNLQEVTEKINSAILAKAELEALQSEADILENQIKEYEMLQSGAVTNFQAKSLAELPSVLIRARIAQRLSQRELADLIGLKEQQIQRYEAEEYSSASLRRLREIADALRLNITEIAEIPPKSNKLEWTKFPIKEMYKRGWFEGFSGSLDAALQEADTLIQSFLSSAVQKPAIAQHRKKVRSGAQIDKYALLAWECRVINLAVQKKNNIPYQRQLITPRWIDELVKASSQLDGPKLAKAMLREVGIKLIIEPQLPNTYLDGAALLYDDFPIIAMTLRFDRLDNFWFVLLHELFHVIKHLQKGKLESVFDDMEALSKEEIELEADNLTSEALIPESKWTHALARYVRSEQSIISFASELGISPAIVAGKIRHEANNYVILSNLIGQDEVRKHFPEVSFGV